MTGKQNGLQCRDVTQGESERLKLKAVRDLSFQSCTEEYKKEMDMKKEILGKKKKSAEIPSQVLFLPLHHCHSLTYGLSHTHKN